MESIKYECTEITSEQYSEVLSEVITNFRNQRYISSPATLLQKGLIFIAQHVVQLYF